MTLKEWVDQERGRLRVMAEFLECTKMNASYITNGKQKPNVEQTNKLHKLTGLSIREINPELADAIDNMRKEG